MSNQNFSNSHPPHPTRPLLFSGAPAYTHPNPGMNSSVPGANQVPFQAPPAMGFQQPEGRPMSGQAFVPGAQHPRRAAGQNPNEYIPPMVYNKQPPQTYLQHQQHPSSSMPPPQQQPQQQQHNQNMYIALPVHSNHVPFNNIQAMENVQHQNIRSHIAGEFEQVAAPLHFTDEAQRQDYYRQLDTKVPAYSTLNLDVLPTGTFLQSLDTYQPKIDTEMLKEIVKSAGMTTADERVYKMQAAMLEMKLLDLLKEVRNVSATSSNAQQTGPRGADPDVMHPKSQLQFEDLAKALEEEGVPLKRPVFLSEKPQQFQAQATTSQQLLAAAMASQQAQAQQTMPPPQATQTDPDAGDAPMLSLL